MREDAEWKARHEDNLPAFKAELRALCEKYGFKLVAESCCSDQVGAKLSVDYGWTIAASGSWGTDAKFPDEDDEAEARRAKR